MSDWFEKLTYGQALDRAASHFGSNEALAFKDRRWTFNELTAEVDKVARALLSLGIEPNERVALWMLNRPEWIFCQFAVTKIGAILLPVNTSFRADALKFVLKHSAASTLIMTKESGP